MNITAHSLIEKHLAWLIALIVVVISLGAIVEIIPLLYQKQITEPVSALRPYSALEFEGRDIYIREGCSVCHSQMIRPFRSETERYGHYSVAGEGVWEHPFLWGSKRTGPDLARVAARFSDDWHRIHLLNPRAVVPASNMPAFPWLELTLLTGQETEKKLRLFRDHFAVPYTEQQLLDAPAQVRGKTEMQALIAYLQALGLAMK